MRDADELVRRLLNGGHSVVAGRLAGAMRACGRNALADDITGDMRAAGYLVTEINPFADPLPVLGALRGESPYVTRVRLIWAEMRSQVIDSFPAKPGPPADKQAYLAAVHDTYVRDAYNSLSIEGYQVTNELIERVAVGNWDPEQNEADLKSKDAKAPVDTSWRAGKLRTQSAGSSTVRTLGAWSRRISVPGTENSLRRASTPSC